MKRGSIVWLQDARDELAKLWFDAPERSGITEAAHTADIQLAADPTGAALYLSEGLWRLSAPPLVLYFELSEDGRTVQVTNVLSVPKDV